MKQLGIVVLVPGFPGSEAETDCLPPVQNFVKVLAANNPDIAVHVISFQYPHQPATYPWFGATVHALGGRNKRFPVRFQSWLQAAHRVWHLTRSYHVLALHSMWLAECTYVASFMARITGTRHIASIRGQDALPGNPYLKHLRFDKMIVTAGSERAAEAFRESTQRRVDYVIPTGLDAEALGDGKSTINRTLDILGVGSLSAIKDFGSFLEIVSVLRADHPALRCRIIGEGPERPQLERYIKEHAMEGAVEFTGRLSREEVLETMRKSKILLHTSRYEGQGYVFLEALGSGMRIVCRDVGYTGSSPGAYRCKTNEEIIGVLQTLLASPLLPIDVKVMLVGDTVKAFEKLYSVRKDSVRQ